MNYLNFIFFVLFVLALAYLIMGLVAYSHTVQNDRADKWLAISPWWAVYTSLYDDFGKKLAHAGKGILVIEVLGFAIWVVVRGV